MCRGLGSGGRGDNLLPFPTQAGSAHPSAGAPSRSRGPAQKPRIATDAQQHGLQASGHSVSLPSTAWRASSPPAGSPPQPSGRSRCGNRRLEHGSSASVFPALVALPFHLISPEQGGRKGEISEIRHFLTYFWPRMDRRTQGFLPHSRLPRPACGI